MIVRRAILFTQLPRHIIRHNGQIASLWMQVRRQSGVSTQRRLFLEATREVPKTPSGLNAYDVMELEPTAVTTLEEMTKQFKKLAVQCHPDREGGSNDKMAELNAAFAIVKEHHHRVTKNLSTMDTAEFASQENLRTSKHDRAKREEDLGRSGGLRQNVRAMNQQNKYRSPKEIQAAWEDLRREREQQAGRMCGRFEVACATGIFFKKAGVLNEIAVRERWLRKQFVKCVWEEVHELRSELLRKGARNVQMSQLAEEMVSFASQTQKKLEEDFTRQAQQMFQAQARFYVQRGVILFIIVTFTVTTIYSMVTGLYNNTTTVKFKGAFFGTDQG